MRTSIMFRPDLRCIHLNRRHTPIRPLSQYIKTFTHKYMCIGPHTHDISVARPFTLALNSILFGSQSDVLQTSSATRANQGWGRISVSELQKIGLFLLRIRTHNSKKLWKRCSAYFLSVYYFAKDSSFTVGTSIFEVDPFSKSS